MFALVVALLQSAFADEVRVLVCGKADDECEKAAWYVPYTVTTLQLNTSFSSDLARVVGTNPLSLFIGPGATGISWDTLPHVDISIMAVMKGWVGKDFYPMEFDFGEAEDYTLLQPSVSIGKPDDYETKEVAVTFTTKKPKLTLRMKKLNISDGRVKSTASIEFHVDRLYADLDYITDQTQTFVVKESVATLNSVDGNVVLSPFKAQDGARPVFLIPDDMGMINMTFEFGKNRFLKCTGVSTSHNVSFSMTVPEGMTLSYYEGESYQFVITPCWFVIRDDGMTEKDLPELAITTILESEFNFAGKWPTCAAPIVTITSLQQFCKIASEGDVPIAFQPGSKVCIGFITLAHLSADRYKGCEVVPTTQSAGMGRVELVKNKIVLIGSDETTKLEIEGTSFKIINDLSHGNVLQLKYSSETTITNLTIDFERGSGAVKIDDSWQTCNSQILTLRSDAGAGSYQNFGYVFHPAKIDINKIAVVNKVEVVTTPVKTLCLTNQRISFCPEEAHPVDSKLLPFYVEGLTEQAIVYVDGTDVPADQELLNMADFRFEKTPSRFAEGTLLIKMDKDYDVTTNISFSSLGVSFSAEKAVTLNAPKMTMDDAHITGKFVTLKVGDASVKFGKEPFRVGLSLEASKMSVVPTRAGDIVHVNDDSVEVSNSSASVLATAKAISITNSAKPDGEIAYVISYTGSGNAIPDLSLAFTRTQNITFPSSNWPSSKVIPVSSSGIINLTLECKVPLELAKQSKLMINFQGLTYLNPSSLDLADLAISTGLNTVTNAYIDRDSVTLSAGHVNATLTRKFNLTVILEQSTRLFVSRLNGITSFTPLLTIVFDVNTADCEFDASWLDYTGSSKVRIDSVGNSYWERQIVTVFHYFGTNEKMQELLDILCESTYLEFQRITSANLCVCGDLTDPQCQANCPFQNAEHILARQISDFVSHASSADPHIYLHFAQTSDPSGSARIDWSDLAKKRPILTTSLPKTFKVILEINDMEENIEYLKATDVHFEFNSDHWMDPDLRMNFAEIYLQDCWLTADRYLKEFVFKTKKGSLAFTPGSMISIDSSSENPFTVPAYSNISVSGTSVTLSDGARSIGLTSVVGGVAIIDSNVSSIRLTTSAVAKVPLSFAFEKAATINVSGSWESSIAISSPVEPCVLILNSKVGVTFAQGSKITTDMASASSIDWTRIEGCQLNITMKDIDEIKVSESQVTISSTASIPTFTLDRSKLNGPFWLFGTQKYQIMTLTRVAGADDIKNFNIHLDENAHVTLTQGWSDYAGTPVYIDNVGDCTFKVLDPAKPQAAFTFSKGVFVDWEVGPAPPTKTSSVGPTATQTITDESHSGGGTSKAGIVAGAVVGVILVIAAVIVVILLVIRFRQKRYSRELTFEFAKDFDSVTGEYREENLETYTPV